MKVRGQVQVQELFTNIIHTRLCFGWAGFWSEAKAVSATSEAVNLNYTRRHERAYFLFGPLQSHVNAEKRRAALP